MAWVPSQRQYDTTLRVRPMPLLHHPLQVVLQCQPRLTPAYGTVQVIKVTAVKRARPFTSGPLVHQLPCGLRDPRRPLILLLAAGCFDGTLQVVEGLVSCRKCLLHTRNGKALRPPR
jgi:hypothetical protein